MNLFCVLIFIISDNIAETDFCLSVAAILDISLLCEGKKLETVFICSVGIYRCEKSSSIKINMNLTQNFDMLHSDMYYYLPSGELRKFTSGAKNWWQVWRPIVKVQLQINYIKLNTLCHILIDYASSQKLPFLRILCPFHRK